MFDPKKVKRDTYYSVLGIELFRIAYVAERLNFPDAINYNQRQDLAKILFELLNIFEENQ